MAIESEICALRKGKRVSSNRPVQDIDRIEVRILLVDGSLIHVMLI